MGVSGDRWTNNNELKSCSETKGDTTEPQPTSCRLQRDKKKKNVRWQRQMASADANVVASQHRSVPPVHPTHFTRISIP